MAGRPPKPTHLRLVGGNAGRRPLPKNEPKPPVAMPEPPQHLSDVAVAEWKRVAQVLFDVGMLTEIDAGMLGAYCQSYSDWLAAEEMLRKFGHVVKSPIRTITTRTRNSEITETAGGYPMPSPYLPIRNRALALMRQFAGEFGMSPAARTRVSVDPNGTNRRQPDAADKYFR